MLQYEAWPLHVPGRTTDFEGEEPMVEGKVKIETDFGRVEGM